MDGEDDLLGGGLLDVVRELERFLQLGPHLDAGADLGEDALALREGEGIELGLEFLLGG